MGAVLGEGAAEGQQRESAPPTPKPSPGPHAVLALLRRILASVDEDIISLEVPRSADEARQSMAFKDSMRETALGDIAGAWYQVGWGVAGEGGSDRGTSGVAKSAMQRVEAGLRPAPRPLPGRRLPRPLPGCCPCRWLGSTTAPIPPLQPRSGHMLEPGLPIHNRMPRVKTAFPLLACLLLARLTPDRPPLPPPSALPTPSPPLPSPSPHPPLTPCPPS